MKKQKKITPVEVFLSVVFGFVLTYFWGLLGFFLLIVAEVLYFKYKPDNHP